MNRSIIVVACSSTLCFAAAAADGAKEKTSTDKLLAQLGSTDIDDRKTALRALQTSLDPRIADAVLPLLGDDGNTIRRLAARAIGSRWY